jgi:hypothetical protein
MKDMKKGASKKIPFPTLNFFLFLLSNPSQQKSSTISLSPAHLWLRYGQYDRLSPETIVG